MPLSRRPKEPEPKPEQSAVDESKKFPIVGVGASAGGLEAFSDLLLHLPRNAGLSYVFIQHLDPRHHSLLTELLQRKTPMKVKQAINGMMPEKDCVYVIPPNTCMEMNGRTLLLTERTSNLVPMPIDAFFRSLAANFGAASIGIVLSGSASDGTLGLKAIKAEGGITFAQEPESAAFDSMPRNAIGAGCVDFISTPAGIAQELVRISRHAYVPEPRTPSATPQLERDFSEIYHILRSTTNVDFSLYKHETIRRRIFRRMALHKIETPDEYVKFIRGRRGEAEALFQDLLINVTAFFREPTTIQALRDRVFPLLLRNRADDDPVRVWIPGCSTGEEAYSFAILLHEFIAQGRSPVPIQIFGTDLSEPALETARAGLYAEGICADISPERLHRFFTKVDGHYQISRTIRDLCIFARQDVTKDPPFSHLDLLICRNLLIYLGAILQKKAINVFHYALKPSGFLVLGVSESVGSSELFAPIDRTLKIYARKPAAINMSVDFESYDDHPQPAPATEPAAENPVDLQKRLDEMLARYTPAAVVVTRDLNVVQFRGQTSRFLEHAAGSANLNLRRMARGGIGLEVQSLIEEIEARKSPLETKLISVRLDGSIADVRLSVSPINGIPGEPQFLVVFEESRERRLPAKSGAAKKVGGKSQAPEGRVAELEEELAVTRRYLQTVVEDQEAITEELKSANEEIQSSNEELQSTNEELLTAKEELQSTNEELTTVNEEMQTRNDELVRTNNDLINLLASVNIPIVMLGGDLRIRRFTPQTERLLNLLPGDIGRSVSDFKLKINVPNLEDIVRGVLDNLAPVEHEVRDAEGRVFSMWIRPYRTADNKIDGAVLALFDVTDRKQATESRFRRLFESSRDGLIVADHATGAILDVNPQATRLLGKGRSELLVMPVFALEVFANAGIRPQTLAELNDKESLRRDVNFVRRDGEWADLEIVAGAYQEPDRRAIQFILRDIGSRRESKTARDGVERNREGRDLEAASRMAASISRNFGNDLTTILILCDLLLREQAASESAADVSKIREAARRAVALDRQLLAFGRRDTGRKELVDLNQVLSGMAQLIGAVMGDRYTLDNQTQPGLRAVEASPAQIERIILNLLINARQPGPAQGNISVQTANVTIDPDFSVRHPAVQPGDYVSITVTESTRQSQPESQAAADPFRPDPSQYSGLPAAFETIRALGAQVWAFSELGVGSTVRVFFNPAAGAAAAETHPGDEAVHTGETVLLIDPDDEFRMAAARGLEANGYSVLQARSAAEARGVIEKHSGGVSAVITDLDHDERITHAATEIAEACRAALAYISSEPDAVLARHGVLNNPDLLLRKPFSADQLVFLVRELLQRNPSG